jgi:hypothetical protein
MPDTTFENLAGGRRGPTYCGRELDAAKVPWIDGPIYGETKASVIGVLHGWVFTRAWYYWIVRTSGEPLSHAMALALNEASGEQVRAYGFGGGTDIDDDDLPENYHVDTQEGLIALADAIRLHASTSPASQRANEQ